MSCVIARQFPWHQGLPMRRRKGWGERDITIAAPPRTPERLRRIIHLSPALLDRTRLFFAGDDVRDLEEIVRIALGAVRLTDEDIRHQLVIAFAEIGGVLDQPD